MADDLTPEQAAIMVLLDRVEALEQRLCEIDKATDLDAYRRRLRAGVGVTRPELRVVGSARRSR